MNRFMGAVKKGITGVQDAYSKQKRISEDRAKRKMWAARTRYEAERVKAEWELEKLQLQREMYEAKAAVRQEREAVAKARRDAGVTSLSERVEGFARGLYYGSSKRKTVKRKPVKRRKK